MAKLHFRYGAMNCGKTSRIIQEAFNYESRGKKVIVAKPSVDTKGRHKIVARIGASRKVDILIGPKDNLLDLFVPIFKNRQVSCVFIDEAQFLTASQANQLYWDIAEDLNVPVIAYGLRADFLSIPFPASERLMTLADELEELPTICICGKKARFNGRKKAGKFIFEGDQVAIDGEGVEYDSLCKDCYRKEYLKAKVNNVPSSI